MCNSFCNIGPCSCSLYLYHFSYVINSYYITTIKVSIVFKRYSYYKSILFTFYNIVKLYFFVLSPIFFILFYEIFYLRKRNILLSLETPKTPDLTPVRIDSVNLLLSSICSFAVTRSCLWSNNCLIILLKLNINL